AVEDWGFVQSVRRKLGEKGWIAMSWPKEYGGQDASSMKQVIFIEEMAYYRCPGRDTQGGRLVGPVIILHGTEEQKKKHLGAIARGEAVWAQGFSEPESGSDLASLKTKAVEDGDDFVINGQKIWSSFAHKADWMHVLARTDPSVPKHKGISYFLVDLKTPGVTVRPIVDITGRHRFNETFFDNVRVPKQNLLGPKNGGWYVAVQTLDFERAGVEYPAWMRRLLAELVAYAKETRRNGVPLSKEPLVRNKLAERAIEIECNRMLAYRIAWLQSKGIVPNYEASVTKVYRGELFQRLTNTGMQIMGLSGQLGEGSTWARLRGRLMFQYMFTLAGTIAGGTSEIQRNIVALRGLGLPR
nr:acyl-CoA dehydrogenase family protein [Chloroflexota bacterium]